ncbi:Arc family DNA-binding protein [Serratia ureilytica]|uniref:Arc family DNA-binding protein n=1 Tax=Serratia ureilytica TaxID=300181 RepID=UPI0037164E42
MSREDAQMKIRLPAELKPDLELLSQRNNRSMNAEIVFRLLRSVDADIGKEKASNFMDKLHEKFPVEEISETDKQAADIEILKKNTEMIKAQVEAIKQEISHQLALGRQWVDEDDKTS